MSSIASSDLKKDEAHGSTVPTMNPLPHLKEEQEDEAVKIAGYERQAYTEEEEMVVRRKIDRRVSLKGEGVTLPVQRRGFG